MKIFAILMLSKVLKENNIAGKLVINWNQPGIKKIIFIHIQVHFVFPITVKNYFHLYIFKLFSIQMQNIRVVLNQSRQPIIMSK